MLHELKVLFLFPTTDINDVIEDLHNDFYTSTLTTTDSSGRKNRHHHAKGLSVQVREKRRRHRMRDNMVIINVAPLFTAHACRWRPHCS